jgi:hypothetical protein
MGLTFHGTRDEQYRQFWEFCRTNYSGNVKARWHLRDRYLALWTNAFVNVLCCIRVFNIIKVKRTKQRLLTVSILSNYGIHETLLQQSICHQANIRSFGSKGVSVLRLDKDRFTPHAQDVLDVWQAQLRRLLKDRYGEAYISSPLGLDRPFEWINYNVRKSPVKVVSFANTDELRAFLRDNPYFGE